MLLILTEVHIVMKKECLTFQESNPKCLWDLQSAQQELFTCLKPEVSLGSRNKDHVVKEMCKTNADKVSIH